MQNWSISDFSQCNHELKAVNSLDNVKSVGESAFKGNDLTDLEISDKPEDIGEGEFRFYFELDRETGTIYDYKLEKAVKELGKETALNVVVPSKIAGVKVKRIKSVSAYKLRALDPLPSFELGELRSIKIPKSVVKIGPHTFSVAESSKISIQMPAGVEIDKDSFYKRFNEVYEDNDREAGLYVKKKGTSEWYKQE